MFEKILRHPDTNIPLVKRDGIIRALYISEEEELPPGCDFLVDEVGNYLMDGEYYLIVCNE